MTYFSASLRGLLAAFLIAVMPAVVHGQSWNIGGNNIGIGVDPLLGTTSNDSLKFITNNTFRMIIQKEGFVGINTLTPNATLGMKSMGRGNDTKAIEIRNMDDVPTALIWDNGDCAFGLGIPGISKWAFSDTLLNPVFSIRAKANGTATGVASIALGVLPIGAWDSAKANGVGAWLMSFRHDTYGAGTSGSLVFLSQDTLRGDGGNVTQQFCLGMKPNSDVVMNRNLGLGGVNDPGARLQSKAAGHTSSTASVNIQDDNSSTMFYIRDDGRTGLGTTSPGARMEILGTGTTSSTSSLIVRNSDTALFVRDDGAVCLGTNSPAANYRLTVSGTALANSWDMSSDIRFKQNIRSITGAWRTIQQLRPVYFNWRRDEFPDRHFSGDTVAGFVAQELAEVFPEFVHRDAGGYLSVSYSSIIPVLVAALKEQGEMLDSKTIELSELMGRVARLEHTLGIERHEEGQVQPPSDGEEAILTNAPNPLLNETVVRFSLPLETRTAEIVFYALESGNEVKRMSLNVPGPHSLRVTASDLPAGAYSYCILADGRIFSSRRLVVIK